MGEWGINTYLLTTQLHKSELRSAGEPILTDDGKDKEGSRPTIPASQKTTQPIALPHQKVFFWKRNWKLPWLCSLENCFNELYWVCISRRYLFKNHQFSFFPQYFRNVCETKTLFLLVTVSFCIHQVQKEKRLGHHSENWKFYFVVKRTTGHFRF